jgi:hypothetical protein
VNVTIAPTPTVIQPSSGQRYGSKASEGRLREQVAHVAVPRSATTRAASIAGIAGWWRFGWYVLGVSNWKLAVVPFEVHW